MITTVTTAEIVQLPRSGRALSEWRRARAVELALAGYSYDDIATEVGYANRGTAWRTVTDALARHTGTNVESYRELELARLEKILAAHWSAATSGTNIKAADLVTKLIAQRTKLMGLDGRPPEDPRGPRMIVVGASGDYAGDLRRICGSTDESDPKQLLTGDT